MLLNGSEIFAEVLLEENVDLIFGYPGGSVLNLYDTLYKYEDKIKHILTVDECSAGHAADGYARSSGKTGVVLSTSGPGATNLVTAITTAQMDSIPMVAITGNVPNSLIGKDSFQEVFITGVTMPVTKHNFFVRSVEDLADILRRAFYIAQSGRKGVVLVDIPKDITYAQTEYTKKTAYKSDYKVSVDNEDIIEACTLINNAKRPVIYFGGGTNTIDNSNVMRDFINKTNIFATHTIMACGVLEYNEKYNLGMIGMHGKSSANYVINEADVVVAIGTRFSDRVALNTDKFAKQAKIIHIEIDPSEVHKNVNVDYSLIGDLKDILAAMVTNIKKLEDRDNLDWINDIEKAKKSDYKPSDDGSYLKPHRIIEAICNKTNNNGVYVTDVGQHQMWSAQFINHKNARSFITSGGLGTMGFGYGAAIGAKFCMPNKTVVHITGDGSFAMNLNQVATAVNHNLQIITVIMNNKTLGMVRQWQTIFYDKRYSNTDIVNKTNYVAVAEGFGAKGFHCESIESLNNALDIALKYNGPTWIECFIDKDEKVLPMIPSGGSFENIIMN